MHKLLKIFGLRECEHCGRIFAQWSGKNIFEVHKQTGRLKWYCDEHAPDFDVCLNIYNSRFDYNNCIKFRINPTTGYEIYPKD